MNDKSTGKKRMDLKESLWGVLSNHLSFPILSPVLAVAGKYQIPHRASPSFSLLWRVEPRWGFFLFILALQLCLL